MNVVPAFRMPTPVTRACAAAISLALMLGVTGPTFGQSASSDPVIATVNGTEVHESELRLVDELIGRNLPSRDPVERRDSVIKLLIDTILLSHEAKDRKLGDDADIQRRITFARNQGLMNHLLVTVGREAVTEEAIRKAYEEVVVKPANDDPEFHLRHILFLAKDPKDEAGAKAAEEKAKAALDRIKKGEDFVTVVADTSDDPVTKATGGDFGWRTRIEMGKEYADAASKLKKGEVSPLIRTSVGWHIIKLEDQRIRKPEPLEKIRDRIAAMVSGSAQIDFVHKVRSAAKIELVGQPADKPNDKQAAPQN